MSFQAKFAAVAGGLIVIPLLCAGLIGVMIGPKPDAPARVVAESAPVVSATGKHATKSRHFGCVNAALYKEALTLLLSDEPLSS